MRSQSIRRSHHRPASRQRGLVLFFALIALVAMTLAALALVRSVDTTTLISGNLAFKQAATTSGDEGVEAAMTWLAAVNDANKALKVTDDPTHPFNKTCLAIAGTCTAIVRGYHSSVDTTLSLTAVDTWNEVNYFNYVLLTWDVDGNVKTDGTGVVLTDRSGNTIRYIIQRLCRTANQPIGSADCLFPGAFEDTEGHHVRSPQEVCKGPGCPVPGQSPQIRVTTKTEGPRGTVSYVQAFVY